THGSRNANCDVAFPIRQNPPPIPKIILRIVTALRTRPSFTFPRTKMAAVKATTALIRTGSGNFTGSSATPGILIGVSKSPSKTPFSEVPVNSTTPISAPQTAKKETAALSNLADLQAQPAPKRCALSHDAVIVEDASTM